MSALVDMHARDIIPGDYVRIDGGLQRVLAAGPGRMPHHTALSTALDTYQFPNLAALQVAFCSVEPV